jgi:hypothetical protein
MKTREKKVLTFNDLKFEEHPTMVGMNKTTKELEEASKLPDELKQYKHEGVQATHKFNNGLCISVIQMKMTVTKDGKSTVIYLSYSTSDDEYELMITASNPVAHEKFENYVKDNPKTILRLGDPLGYLSKDEVTEVMKALQNI